MAQIMQEVNCCFNNNCAN